MRVFDGAVVAVSHDRYLLDETVDARSPSSPAGAIRMWPGNYSAYTVARELELQRQQQLYVTQQKEIARLEEAIRALQGLGEPRRRRAPHQAGAQQAAPDRPHGEGRAARARAAQDRARAAPARARRRAGRRARRRVGVELGERPDPRRRRPDRAARRARRRRRRERRRQVGAAAHPRAASSSPTTASGRRGRRSGSAASRRTAAPTIPRRRRSSSCAARRRSRKARPCRA